MYNWKKIFCLMILSAALVFNMLNGDKAKAANWACYQWDDGHNELPCRVVDASDEASATRACDNGGTYMVIEGDCRPLGGGQNQTTPVAPVKSCICEGDVHVNLGGKAIASAAGFSIENVCKQYKGTFDGGALSDSCKGLKVDINSTGQAECEKITKEQVMTKLGVPDNISGFGSFSASCSWKVVDNTAQPATNQSKVVGTGCEIKKGQEVCVLENPLAGDKTSVGAIISTIIKTALTIIGALALLMFVWGGFQWLTSAGNDQKVEAGTKTMLWAVVGIILVFASYVLLSTFTDYLTRSA